MGRKRPRPGARLGISWLQRRNRLGDAACPGRRHTEHTERPGSPGAAGTEHGRARSRPVRRAPARPRVPRHGPAGGARRAHLPAGQPGLGVPELGRPEAVHGAPGPPRRAALSPAPPGPAPLLGSAHGGFPFWQSCSTQRDVGRPPPRPQQRAEPPRAAVREAEPRTRRVTRPFPSRPAARFPHGAVSFLPRPARRLKEPRPHGAAWSSVSIEARNRHGPEPGGRRRAVRTALSSGITAARPPSARPLSTARPGPRGPRLAGHPAVGARTSAKAQPLTRAEREPAVRRRLALTAAAEEEEERVGARPRPPAAPSHLRSLLTRSRPG